MILKFHLANQKLSKDKEIDDLHIVADSRNYLIAHFEWETDEWKDKLIYVLFTHKKQTYQVVLGMDARLPVNECYVPNEVINTPGFTVSCHCGDLITTNPVQINLKSSGYTDDVIENTPTNPETNEIYIVNGETLKQTIEELYDVKMDVQPILTTTEALKLTLEAQQQWMSTLIYDAGDASQYFEE